MNNIAVIEALLFVAGNDGLSLEELSKQLDKVDRGELRKKISELDVEKIKEMKIDVKEIKSRLTAADIEKIKKLAGKDSDLIMKKFNELS